MFPRAPGACSLASESLTPLAIQSDGSAPILCVLAHLFSEIQLLHVTTVTSIPILRSTTRQHSTHQRKPCHLTLKDTRLFYSFVVAGDGVDGHGLQHLGNAIDAIRGQAADNTATAIRYGCRSMYLPMTTPCSSALQSLRSIRPHPIRGRG